MAYVLVFLWGYLVGSGEFGRQHSMANIVKGVAYGVVFILGGQGRKFCAL